MRQNQKGSAKESKNQQASYVKNMSCLRPDLRPEPKIILERQALQAWDCTSEQFIIMAFLATNPDKEIKSRVIKEKLNKILGNAYNDSKILHLMKNSKLIEFCSMYKKVEVDDNIVSTRVSHENEKCKAENVFFMTAGTAEKVRDILSIKRTEPSDEWQVVSFKNLYHNNRKFQVITNVVVRETLHTRNALGISWEIPFTAKQISSKCNLLNGYLFTEHNIPAIIAAATRKFINSMNNNYPYNNNLFDLSNTVDRSTPKTVYRMASWAVDLVLEETKKEQDCTNNLVI